MTEVSPPRLAAYIAGRLPAARDVRVDDLSRIHGGASRETYRFRLRYNDAKAGEVERRLILRRDPAASLIETDRKTEFFAYRAFGGTSVPVPEMIWLEEEAGPLDRPFFIAEEIVGCEASAAELLVEPYRSKAETIGTRKWSILGEIARADPAALGLTEIMTAPAPEACWRRELGHWEAVIDADAVAPQPIMRAAIRRLRAAPPPPAQRIAVVHGDFRSGNFLYDTEGEIHGVLDWEMAHLGDPLEDLAWSLNRVWCWGGDDRRGGLLPRDRAIAIWERASSFSVSPNALAWWELFSCVKGQAIWASSAKAWSGGANRDPVMAFTAWRMTNAQDRAALELMHRL